MSLLVCMITASPSNCLHCSIDNSIKLPIIIYHSILKSRKGTYITPPANLMSNIQWLKDHSYTSSFIKDAIEHCEGRTPLSPLSRCLLLSTTDATTITLFFSNSERYWL